MSFFKKLVRVLAVLLFALNTGSCAAAAPIRIGFVAVLTGPLAELGVAGRDGAILAVEEVNRAGGIDGRRLELLPYDDHYDAAEAVKVIDELREQDAVAAVGLMISAEVEAVFEKINRENFVVISPTATSTNYSGKKDFFFRVVADTDRLGTALGGWVYDTGMRRIGGVFEEANRAYAENLLNAARDEFGARGGEMVKVFSYRSGEADLSALAMQLAAEDLEGVILSSPAKDTALIAQYLHESNSDLRIFSVPWSQTSELLDKGGRAVNGMELLALYDPNNPNQDFQTFSALFNDRFSRAPEFGAAYGYEAVMVLAEALRKTGGSADGLGNALVEIRQYAGVQSPIHLDENGDCVRSLYVMRIEDGAYRVVATILPEGE
jgi:branched-chain amino acid transport system substrate-binding protein